MLVKPEERTAPAEAPFVPQSLVPQSFRWAAWPRFVIETAAAASRSTGALLTTGFWIGFLMLIWGWLPLKPLVQVVRDQDGVGMVAACAITYVLLLLAATALIGPEGVCARALRRRWAGQAPWRPSPRGIALLVLVAVLAWTGRPLLHAPLMLLYQYPLVTWIPVAAGFAVAGVCAAVAYQLRGSMDAALQAAISVRIPVTVVLGAAFLVMLPSLQGSALYLATDYVSTDQLPGTTQPRLLPKSAAIAYGSDKGMRHAHLVVDPSTDGLAWTAEHRPGLVVRGASDAIAEQPLDRIDGSVEQVGRGFDPAVAKVGPGSIPWRAYKRHYFTRLGESVIVPLGGDQAVAVVPYIGYRGFPVRHPYWRGVYVYHQDGRLEDLTPVEAMARPELRQSGRLFPEKLARDIAEAYGYRTGPAAKAKGRTRTEVGDPGGNRQPYLTNLGDGQIRWVTVAHVAGDRDRIAAIFLTNSATGATEIWRPPPGIDLLSNEGAAALAHTLDLKWTECCDGDGFEYDIRRVTEPRPVFLRGRFYFLVSIVPDYEWVDSDQPVDRTVLIDAEKHRIVHVFEHSDPEADDKLRNFLAREAS